MEDKISRKWAEIFGVGWQKIMEICPEIGGFLLDHENRRVYMDRNAEKLTETDELPDYDAMTDFLQILGNDTTSFARLLPQVFYDDGKFTAGILRWHYDFSGAQAKSVVPMVEKSKLASIIGAGKAGSLLALLEFYVSDRSDLAEYQIFGALSCVIANAPAGAVLAADHTDSFWLYVPEFDGSAEEFLTKVQREVEQSGQANRLGETGVGERYITFCAGIGADNLPADRRMSTAEFALYQANVAGNGSIMSYSSEQYESNKTEYEKMSRFFRLMNENLFIYHFQPIVSAKDGEVVAYEMLMRTDSSIGLNPLEILDCAEKVGRLYDIEKATMRNGLAIIERHQDIFKKRKLFVNSITAYTLSDEDWEELVKQYGELMEKMVVEFTEQTEIDDRGIDKIRRRFLRLNIKTAIDDFGTGYSNTSNLIKYSPHYVKIDRSLISGIDGKPTVRKLVSSFIEFIHESGYYALAEGVETYEELQTMIQLGADLIQGFYVSKPKPIMLFEVSDNICDDIEKINLINSGSIARPYYPEDGEDVDLTFIKSSGYNSVFVECENVTLHGRTDIHIDLILSVKAGIKTNITLKNCKLKTDREDPIVNIGEGSDVVLTVSGDDYLDGKGILVPHNSKLLINGEGFLNVVANAENCFAIGCGMGSSPGQIVIDLEGKLNVTANGDTVTAIGGGHNEYDTAIRLIGGEVNVKCSGRSCVGIGIYEGNSIIDFDGSSCSVEITAPNIVGIGSFGKSINVNLKSFRLTEVLSGIRATAIGTVEEGTGTVMLSRGSVDMTVKARTVNCIGTRGGDMYCHVKSSKVKAYCEGGTVSGIGDIDGSGDVRIEDTELDFDFRTADGFGYGSKNGVTKVTSISENIMINE